MNGGRTTELRLELPADEVAVLDGYTQATGKTRTQVMRDILKLWSEAKLHEAMIVMRVAGRNPGVSGGDRHE